MKRVFIPIILWYLRLGARIQIKKTNPTIIGVGGSSGKSSLTRLIAGILKDHFVISATQEKNSETGIPLHILNIHFDFSYSKWFETLFLVPFRLLFYWPKYQFLLAEMGIDSPVEPKNMSYLLKIIQPTIGVVTNITAEHSVYFDPYIKETDEKIRKKKVLEMTSEQEILLLTSLPANGVAVVNLDDESIATFSTKIKARQITISTKLSSATLFGQEILLTSEYFSMEIVYKGNAYRLVISQPLPSHFSYEFLCAVGVALSCGLSIQEAVESVEKNFSLPPGRMSVFKGIKNTLLVDSSYNNATLPPIIDMLQLLRKIAGTRRKVAIVGDMRELGSQSKENHQKVALELLKTTNMAILIGPLLKNYAAPILKKANYSYFSFDTFTSAKQTILKEIKEKDIILVKGSQNTLFLERVVEMLLENKEDSKKLCRRGDFWDKKRAESL